MKKYTFLFVIFTLLLSVRIVFCQTCDCEALQNEINDLNNQINILKGYSPDKISEEELQNHGFCKISDDFFIRLYNFNITENQKDEFGRSYNSLSFYLLFRNNSKTTTNFSNSLDMRVFQNGIELDRIRSNNSIVNEELEKDINRFVRPGSGNSIYLNYKLLFTSGSIEIEVWKNKIQKIFIPVLYTT